MGKLPRPSRLRRWWWRVCWWLTPRGLDRPYIRLEPCMLWGSPVIGGHRITAEQMADYYWYTADTAEEMQRAWNLTRGELLIAFWYMGRWGSRTWQKRWRAWAESVHPQLWECDYSAPWPPKAEA